MGTQDSFPKIIKMDRSANRGEESLVRAAKGEDMSSGAWVTDAGRRHMGREANWKQQDTPN